MNFDLIKDNKILLTFCRPNEQQAVEYVHTLFEDNKHPCIRHKNIKDCKLRKRKIIFEYIEI